MVPIISERHKFFYQFICFEQLLDDNYMNIEEFCSCGMVKYPLLVEHPWSSNTGYKMSVKNILEALNYV